ncbi:hypothetical protein SAMN05216505_11441 [Streptomyces prasinopilosus]|uniref:Uncharacterized protein n=1 Tax=Streptomyces prasinopilosus TaxID=67344 RepID=A0A1G6Z1H4_9ACTN|nr:DUF6274 family protein [Streptomyces prasinopilosus]SDD96163.1 hypothetical protein SAMN05216505_11441 [Streptomyces prasinopilosus]
MPAPSRHETRALLRAHLSAASSLGHLTRHCPVCHRLLRLAMDSAPPAVEHTGQPPRTIDPPRPTEPSRPAEPLRPAGSAARPPRHEAGEGAPTVRPDDSDDPAGPVPAPRTRVAPPRVRRPPL